MVEGGGKRCGRVGVAPGGNGSKGDGKWDGQAIILERCEVCSERHTWLAVPGERAPGWEWRARGEETKQCAQEAQCVVCGKGGATWECGTCEEEVHLGCALPALDQRWAMCPVWFRMTGRLPGSSAGVQMEQTA